MFSSDEFILKLLTVSNLVKDYDPVISIVEHFNGLMDTKDN